MAGSLNEAMALWKSWEALFEVLQGAAEFEMLLESKRLYLYRNAAGYLIVAAKNTAAMPLIRQTCQNIMTDPDPVKSTATQS